MGGVEHNRLGGTGDLGVAGNQNHLIRAVAVGGGGEGFDHQLGVLGERVEEGLSIAFHVGLGKGAGGGFLFNPLNQVKLGSGFVLRATAAFYAEPDAIGHAHGNQGDTLGVAGDGNIRQGTV